MPQSITVVLFAAVTQLFLFWPYPPHTTIYTEGGEGRACLPSSGSGRPPPFGGGLGINLNVYSFMPRYVCPRQLNSSFTSVRLR